MLNLIELERHVLDPSCKLWLPLSFLDAPAGAASLRSHDAYGTPFTPIGAIWTPDGWFFDGVDDRLKNDTPLQHAHLDFTSEDFSGIIRVYYENTGDTANFLVRAQWNTTGYMWVMQGTRTQRLYTFQAGANQSTTGTANPSGELYTFGFSRHGADVTFYCNGRIDPLTTSDSHIDPVTAPRALGLFADAGGGSPFKGRVYCMAIWQRWLSPHEHADLHQMFKEVFG